jgi:hypothetical protein
VILGVGLLEEILKVAPVLQTDSAGALAICDLEEERVFSSFDLALLRQHVSHGSMVAGSDVHKSSVGGAMLLLASRSARVTRRSLIVENRQFVSAVSTAGPQSIQV